MGRPLKKNSRTQQDVIRAAIACIDTDGESALGVNRVARELGIKPPAIYKHVAGNAGLRRAVALDIWRTYLTDIQNRTIGLTQPRDLIQVGAKMTRHFALNYPARYRVMMHYQMRPTDSEEAAIIQRSLHLLQQSLELYHLNDDALIDVMRMLNAAIYGFITKEQSELMTLSRSTDESFEAMLSALLVAIDHIRYCDASAIA